MNVRTDTEPTPSRNNLQIHRRRILISTYLVLMLIMVLKAEHEIEMNPVFREFNMSILHLVISAVLLDLSRDSSSFAMTPNNQKPVSAFFLMASGLSFALSLKYAYSAFLFAFGS